MSVENKKGLQLKREIMMSVESFINLYKPILCIFSSSAVLYSTHYIYVHMEDLITIERLLQKDMKEVKNAYPLPVSMSQHLPLVLFSILPLFHVPSALLSL